MRIALTNFMRVPPSMHQENKTKRNAVGTADTVPVNPDTCSISFGGKSSPVVVRGKQIEGFKNTAIKVAVGLGGYAGLLGGLAAALTVPFAAPAIGATLAAKTFLGGKAGITVNGRTLDFMRPLDVKTSDSKTKKLTKQALNLAARTGTSVSVGIVGAAGAPVVAAIGGAALGAQLVAQSVFRLLPV